MGRKLGAAVPLIFRGAGSPSNTISPEPRPTSIPSGILIHPAVWPQRTWAFGGCCADYARVSWGTLVPPVKYDSTCASFGPPVSTTQTANRSVQPFLRSSRQKVPTLYNKRPFPTKLPLLMGNLDAHLIHDSLGEYEPIIQTASLSVQPFLHRYRRVSIYFTMGRPFPFKIAHSHRGCGPPSNTWLPGPARVLNPNGISIGSAFFAGLV